MSAPRKAVMIATDTRARMIYVRFAEKVDMIGLDAAEARLLARSLMSAARDLDTPEPRACAPRPRKAGGL